MLKIVPDPPHNHHSLEDTLVQATEYALCAQAVAHQAISVQQPKSHASILIMALMHEIEALLWASYYLSALAKALMDDAELGMKH